MPRKLLWDLDAWEDYLYWQTQDKKVLGKPEPLKENLSGLWSRRIDSSNRLVYAVEDNVITILSCRTHYRM